MYFIINKVVQLHHVHVSNCYWRVIGLSCSAFIKCYLTFCRKSTLFEESFYFCFFCTLKYRGCNVKSEGLCCPAKMRLEYLPNIHSRWHTERIKNNVNRGSIRKIRHVFIQQNHRTYSFVTMTTCHLITYLDFSFHRNIYLYYFIHPRG